MNAPTPNIWGDKRPEPNLYAEMAVLASIINDNNFYWEIDGWLGEEHFTDPLHRRIFALCKDGITKGSGASPPTIIPALQGDATFEAAGGVSYLIQITGVSHRPREIKSYAQAVADRFKRVGLWGVGDEIKYIAANEDEDLQEMLSRTETLVAEVVDDARPSDRVRTLSETVVTALTEAAEASKQEDGIIGCPTGLTRLDDVLGGLKDSNLIVMAGRPGMGKSAAALSVALNAARAGKGIGFITLEMRGEELVYRALSAVASELDMDLPYSEVSRGRFTGGQMEVLRHAQAKLDDLPFLVEDTGRKTVASIRSIARSMDRTFKKQEKRLDCLFVDHLSIIKPEGAYRGNKVSETEQISNDLKALAKQLDVPVVALCQLSREVEKRDNKRPFLSDLRFSGAIEQDADVILFLYREAYYLEQSKPKTFEDNYEDWKTEFDECKHRLDVICAKNRHGRTADIRLHCEIEKNLILDKDPLRLYQNQFDLGE
jgi:replicative DNA helicase